MNYKNIFILLVVILIVFFIVSIFTRSIKNENLEENEMTEPELIESGEEKGFNVKGEYDKFYVVPPSLWPKVTIGGTLSAVIVYVALIFGIASYFIGHNAGGKMNKKTIFASIGTATLVGICGRSITILARVKLYELLKYIFSDNQILAGTISDLIIYILWITFIAGISVYLYETFTVTAKEAHPMQ